MEVPAALAAVTKAFIDFMSREPVSEVERRLQEVMPGLIGLDPAVPQVFQGGRAAVDESERVDPKSKRRTK